MSCSDFIHPLRRDGTSQRQRRLAALAPESVPVDERGLDHHLLYLRDYSKLLRFTTPENLPGGDWLALIDGDPSLQVAEIATADLEALQRVADEALDDLREILDASPSDANLVLAFNRQLGPIYAIARDLDRRHRQAEPRLGLRPALDRLIRSILADALRGALGVALRARDVGLEVRALDPATLGSAWALGGTAADTSYFASGSPIVEQALLAGERLRALHRRMVEGLVALRGMAPELLRETLERWPAHPPHMALLIAFLDLLSHARDQVNSLGRKHLDFYYRRVLALEPRAAVPDRAHVVFSPAKGTDAHRLEPGVELKAGKDAAGVVRRYATDDELILRPTALDAEHGLKSVFVERDEAGDISNIYAAPQAASADGRGAPLDEEGKWPAFGNASMPFAELGFAVASSMFLLAEGTRTITLTLDMVTGLVTSDAIRERIEAELKTNLRVQASGADGWIDVALTAVSFGEEELVFTLRIGAAEPAVLAYDPEKLDGGFGSRQPLLRFLLDDAGRAAERDSQDEIEPSYPYKYLENVLVEGLRIKVDVKGLRTLILESDVGLLEPAKPFMPFGPVPKRGGSFLLGSYEVFHKPLTHLGLDITWAALPEESFKDHYAEYETELGSDDMTAVRSSGNEYFKADVEILDGGAWSEVKSDVSLFEDPRVLGTSPPPAATRGLDFDDLSDLTRDVRLEPFSRFDPSLRRGFLRLRLEKSFLHEEHALVLAKAVVGKDADPAKIPNAPYTPLISSFELDYTASLAVSKDDLESGRETLFQVGPFGHLPATPLDQPTDAAAPRFERHLLPQFPVGDAGDELATARQAEGTLLIGLVNARPPEVLSMLVQVAEGSEDPGVEPSPITWSYLAGEHWREFQTAEILADGTRGLLQSGLVRLSVPEEMSPSTTLLPAGRFWLKASLESGSAGTAKLIAVHPQAMSASFEDQGNDPRHLEKPLPAESIDRLVKRRAQVKKVAQPYASFGGRPRESDAAFDTRVSERLRHRGRAVAVWDYERLVLENFPDVYKARCLSHSREGCEHAPGHTRLVVLPDLRNKNAVDPLEPRLSRARLRAIEEFLRPLATDFVQLAVTNPDYERVKVLFDVRFTAGQDDGFASRRLEQEIIGFLSPWLYDDAADLALGGRIHRSQVLDFVEKRDYVDFVRDFRLDHQLSEEPDSWQEDVIEAVATRSSVALVSYAEHEVRPGAASCVDGDGRAAAGGGRWLGNEHTRELHDLRNIQVNCQLNEIALERRLAFDTLQHALDAGYDFCAYCFGRQRSRR